MSRAYCFKCKACDAVWINSADLLGLHPTNGCTELDIVRDYKAEAVGIGSGVRVSRIKPEEKKTPPPQVKTVTPGGV